MGGEWIRPEKVTEFDLPEVVCGALDELADEYSTLLVEGAGSPAELGIPSPDLANWVPIQHLDASILLMTEAAMGGAHAHLLGTLALMPDALRRRVRGLIINKVPAAALESTVRASKQLETLSGVPVLGCLPLLHDVHIPSEELRADCTSAVVTPSAPCFARLTSELIPYFDVDEIIRVVTDGEEN